MLPADATEPVLFARMQEIDRTLKLSHAEQGLICKAVRDRQLYRERTDTDGQPCSMSSWIRLASPWSYSSTYQAMKDVDELQDIPPEQLARVPTSSFPILKQLSTAVRAEPGIMQAVISQSTDEFVETVRRDYPNQHVESRKIFRFTPEESAAKIIEQALGEAEKRGAANRNEALEMICQEIVETWRFENEIETLAHDESAESPM